MDIKVRAASAIKNLPPFPPVAAKVITLLADDSASMREVAGTLSTGRDALSRGASVGEFGAL